MEKLRSEKETIKGVNREFKLLSWSVRLILIFGLLLADVSERLVGSIPHFPLIKHSPQHYPSILIDPEAGTNKVFRNVGQ